MGTGTSVGQITSYNNSTVTISGGTVQEVDAWDGSHFEISDGSINNRLIAGGTSQVNMSGGNVFDLTAGDDSQVSMSDGQVDYLAGFGRQHGRCYRRIDWIFVCW